MRPSQDPNNIWNKVSFSSMCSVRTSLSEPIALSYRVVHTCLMNSSNAFPLYRSRDLRARVCVSTVSSLFARVVLQRANPNITYYKSTRMSNCPFLFYQLLPFVLWTMSCSNNKDSKRRSKRVIWFKIQCRVYIPGRLVMWQEFCGYIFWNHEDSLFARY